MHFDFNNLRTVKAAEGSIMASLGLEKYDILMARYEELLKEICVSDQTDIDFING